jgi:hypothetical protein
LGKDTELALRLNQEEVVIDLNKELLWNYTLVSRSPLQC